MILGDEGALMAEDATLLNDKVAGERVFPYMEASARGGLAEGKCVVNLGEERKGSRTEDTTVLSE